MPKVLGSGVVLYNSNIHECYLPDNPCMKGSLSIGSIWKCNCGIYYKAHYINWHEISEKKAKKLLVKHGVKE